MSSPAIVCQPYGQGSEHETRGDPDEEVSMWRESWPFKHVPSFEVWAASLCYEKGGGGPFKDLLKHTLTIQLSKPSGIPMFSDHKAFDTFLKKQPMNAKLETVGGRNSEAYNAEGIYAAQTTHGLEVNWPQMDTGAQSQGLNRGFLSITDRRVVDQGTQKDKSTKSLPSTDLQSGAGTTMPWGLLTLMETCGLTRDMRGVGAKTPCNEQNNYPRQAIGSLGNTTDNKGITQADGCVAAGNYFAAYVGLYWYPGCDRDEYNWYSEQQIEPGGEKYTVRGRLPNPAYGITEQGDDLFVEELVRAPYDKVTKFVSQNGIRFNRHSRTVWDQLSMYSRDKTRPNDVQAGRIVTRIAPFMGRPFPVAYKKDLAKITEKLDTIHWNLLAADGESLPHCKYIDGWCDHLEANHKKWTPRMHKRDDYTKYGKMAWGKQIDGGLAFGWAYPAALQLYPHEPVYNKGTPVQGFLNKTPEKWWYQPWPSLRDDFEFSEFTTENYQAHITPLYTVMQQSPPTMKGRQRYALGLPYADVKSVGEYKELLALDLQSSGTKATGDTDVTKLKAAELKERLKSRGLSTTGTKQVLLKRLQEATSEDPDEADEAQAELDDADEADEAQAELDDADEADETEDDEDDEDDNRPGEDEADEEALPAGEPVREEEVIPAREGPEIVALLDQVLGDSDLLDNRFGTAKEQKVFDRAQAMKAMSALTGEAEDPRRTALPKMQPNMPRRSGDDSGNAHFLSAKDAPWSFRDIYKPNTMDVETDTLGSKKDIEAQLNQYGSTANLILREEKPSKIKAIHHNFGAVRTVKYNGRDTPILEVPIVAALDGKLSGPADVAMFKRNLHRVMKVFYDQSGTLGIKKNGITPADKEKGMVGGLWLPKARQTSGIPNVLFGKQSATYRQILPAVFTSKPKAEDKSNFLVGSDVTKTKKDEKQPPIKLINPEFTVLHWLMSPWHYEYLPFEVMYSLFRDDETYAAGCSRCARPFYEYKYQYQSLPSKQHRYGAHWVNAYWREGRQGTYDFNYAPKPAHYDPFWSDVSIRAYKHEAVVPGTFGETSTEPGKVLGFHGWPVKCFLLGFSERQRGISAVEPCDMTKDPLCAEFTERLKKTTFKKQYVITSRNTKVDKLFGGWPFRQYLNNAWVDGTDYDRFQIIQGCVRAPRAKVAFGMQDYQLQRVNKYSNVCRDCAATLQIVGLYENVGYADDPVQGDGRVVRQPKTTNTLWWADLANKDLVNEKGERVITGYDSNGNSLSQFDPWFLYLMQHGPSMHKESTRQKADAWIRRQTGKDDEFKEQYKTILQQTRGERRNGKWVPRLEVQMKAIFGERWRVMYEAHMATAIHQVKETTCVFEDSDGKYMTKLREPADIHINNKVWKNHFDQNQRNWDMARKEQATAAFEQLRKMIKVLDDGYNELSSNNMIGLPLQNRALRDALAEAQFTLMSHMELKFDEDGYTAKFDPQLHRVERRDLELVEKGVTYEHCLKVSQLKRPQWGVQKVVGGMYTKVWKVGQGSWRGDTYVQNGRPHIEEQIRQLTQSRFFITYVLHRRVEEEKHARYVIEKMADALRAVFGNDQNLCRLLVFGHKLKDNQGGDQIGRMDWVRITKPRKSEKRFYGDGIGSSYEHDTYETHVDSVSCNCGVEIGPHRHLPHAHILLTVNHWSYIHFDTLRFKAIMEQMFKGQSRIGDFRIFDGSGALMYGDSENAWCTVKLYPTDDHDEVIAAYVTKSTTPSIFESLRTRTFSSFARPTETGGRGGRGRGGRGLGRGGGRS